MKTLILAAIRRFLMFSLPAVAIAPSAYATRYEINRSRSDGSGGTASLIGTVDVPLGSYTIMHLGPTPFTSVSLTLIVNGGAPFHLDQVASGVFGTRQFFIFATASSLIFDTANANAKQCGCSAVL